jgi:hypothetical protein
MYNPKARIANYIGGTPVTPSDPNIRPEDYDHSINKAGFRKVRILLVRVFSHYASTKRDITRMALNHMAHMAINFRVDVICGDFNAACYNSSYGQLKRGEDWEPDLTAPAVVEAVQQFQAVFKQNKAYKDRLSVTLRHAHPIAATHKRPSQAQLAGLIEDIDPGTHTMGFIFLGWPVMSRQTRLREYLQQQIVRKTLERDVVCQNDGSDLHYFLAPNVYEMQRAEVHWRA